MNCGCSPTYIGPSLAKTCCGSSFFLFVSILDTLIRRKCDVSEICSRIRPRIKPDKEYDFVVIGGGPGGSAVASRLSENPIWKVLLIETGGDEPPGAQVPSMMLNYLGNPDLDWNFKSEPQDKAFLGFPERRAIWPRGKVLGGTTVINGMTYLLGLPKDYDRWASLGNPGWSWRDVEPIFLLSEDNKQIGSLVSSQYHRTGGLITVSRFNYQPDMAYDVLNAAKVLKFPVRNELIAGNTSGFIITQHTNRGGARLSAARAYLRPAKNRNNLHIMLNSTATQILLEEIENTKTAREVKFIYKNKTFRVRVRKEVIISAGAIKSPHILLLSGIGPKSELQKAGIKQVHELPGVGQNLHNHVSFHLNYDMTKISNTNDLNWATARQYLLNNDGPLSSTGMSQVTARLNTKYSDSPDNPDLQIFFTSFVASCVQTRGLRALKNINEPNEFKQLQISPVTLRAKSRGYIGLKSSDPFEYPLIDPKYLTEKYDVDVLVEGVRIAQKLANSTILQEKYGLRLRRDDYGDCYTRFGENSNEFWECAIRHFTAPENHQAGSCKMGPSSDKLAVVDNKLRVHGIEGLRVADASIMPFMISGNPQATIFMIGEKAAQNIREKWASRQWKILKTCHQ